MYTALLNQWKKHISKHGEKDNGYAITSQCWETIQSHIQPNNFTLETGSGLSTWLFATQHVIHTALEHSPHWFSITTDSLFVQEARVKLRALSNNPNEPSWYIYERMNMPKFNLVLIDGPTGIIGRSGILTRIEFFLSPGGVIIIDDVQREAEAHLGVAISKIFNTSIKYVVSNTRQTFGVIKT